MSAKPPLNIDDLAEHDLLTLQVAIERRLVSLRPRTFGSPGVRDPDAPCDGFEPGVPSGRCKTDGHYMCHECIHCELCDGGCGQIEERCECKVDDHGETMPGTE